MVFAQAAAYLGIISQSPRSEHVSVVTDAITRQGDAGQSSPSPAWAEDEEGRPPYAHAMIAGGLGGTMGDMLMHSLDTVKTRQQGDPHIPPKYTSMASTSYTIWRQEGVARGLYSGVTPAFIGSSAGAVIFFGAYEYTKRRLIDWGMTPELSYLCAGFTADLASSPLYVPSEVVKTRLQLQGRYNNPYFASGYNYRSSIHALTTIIRTEGVSELFSGYKATLLRDLPYSAMQFTFYEIAQQWAREWVGAKDIGLSLEIVTGASAGGLAGIITCPLDVVKTRIQTQLDPVHAPVPAARNTHHTHITPAAHKISARPISPMTTTRHISTGGPSTSLRPPTGSAVLHTESVIAGLRAIYRVEGLGGWFRGVGPRAVWTSIQSGTMLVVYQNVLKWLERYDEGLELE